MIQGINLYKGFGTARHRVDVLKGISIAVEEGRLAVLMGPSGSGKTTLLNQLSLLDRPDSGKLILDGTDVTGLSDEKRDDIRRKKIGFVFQSVALISRMTAWENVDFHLRIAGFSPRERDKRIAECLGMVGLGKRMHHMSNEMSGGEQQRTAIARAISHTPKILFADEPTAELDTATGLKILKIFKTMIAEKGITVVMTSHDPNVAGAADLIFRLEDGVVKSDG